MSKKIVYLHISALAILACMVLGAVRGMAQEERPEIVPQEKTLNKKKKGGEPRAIGLLKLNVNGKATLVPIAILIDGKFWDASSYKADPVPMAIDSGTVYEGEHTGTSLGLFTVNGALHSTNPGSADPWLGTGQWLPQGTEPKKTSHTAETVPVGLETTDEPPRLTKQPPKNASGEANGGTTAKPAETSGSKDSAATTPGSDRKDSSSGGKSDSGKPAASDSTKANAKSDQAAPAPGEDTNSSAAANRPKLRRGQPTQPLPSDDDVPGYAKPGQEASLTPASPDASGEKVADTATAKAEQGDASKAQPQLIPAISDSAGPDPRSYVFEWDKSEADNRRKQVLAFAQEQLKAYVQSRAKATISATPASAKSATGKAAKGKTASSARKPPAKIPDFVLEDVDLRLFDLWANNQPVIVLTAKAHAPLPVVGSAAQADPVPEYTIALAARTDIYNNLHKLYTGVTDKYHLDVTPRLELIDAVDADGDGRGELLFRETSDAGSGYIIYRATADTLWKMFDSLSPE